MMTAHSTNFTDMETQLRALSFDSSRDVEPTILASEEMVLASKKSTRPWRLIGATFMGVAGIVGAIHASGWDWDSIFEVVMPHSPQFESIQSEQSETIQSESKLMEGEVEISSSVMAGHAIQPVLPVVNQIIGSGYSRATQDVVLGAPFAGHVDTVMVTEGDHVIAATPLLRLRDRLAQEAIERARLEIDRASLSAKAEALVLVQAQENFETFQKLAVRGGISAVKLRDAEMAVSAASIDVKNAELAIAEAKFALQVAEKNLAEHEMKAPFSGVVAVLRAMPGLVTAGDQQDALLRLFDPQSLVVDVDIAERRLGDISLELRADVVFDAWPKTTFTAQVVKIAPILSKERGTIRVVIKLDEIPVNLRPNMAARATLNLVETPMQSSTYKQNETRNENDV